MYQKYHQTQLYPVGREVPSDLPFHWYPRFPLYQTYRMYRLYHHRRRRRFH